MELNRFTHIYLIGIGGIGMSALARYFLNHRKFVAGYDKTPSALTEELMQEGAKIHFSDELNLISPPFLLQESTLIIYTPAIPATHKEFLFFKENGYHLLKRSQVLGLLSKDKHCIAIAGTHGKTTVSSMTAHILNNSKVGCNAFLGGITNNYNSNLIVNEKSPNLVIEADEFDRSFLQLFPDVAVITSMDADHLDIYENHQKLKESFRDFADQVNPKGNLIVKFGLEKLLNKRNGLFTYSIETENADFHISAMKLINGIYQFSIFGPNLKIENVQLEMPGKLNVENALAAAAAAFIAGASETEIKTALANFSGVKRRMEYIIKRTDFVYLDDYAHHPEELKASILSVRELFPTKKISGIFQPHLFSRTRDFLNEFAQSLALLDSLILLDIYPAREEPIPGVTSALLLENISLENKILLQKEELIPYLKKQSLEVLITLGAGDIDRMVDPIKRAFE